jgi:hypothetical protein
MAGGETRTRKVLPLACRLSRWISAAVIAAGWLGLYGYWLASGTEPSCQITTVTHSGTPSGVTTTRTCGLPGSTAYVYVAAVVVLLLLPDAKSISVPGIRYEARDDVGPVSQVTSGAVAGDTLADSQAAVGVIASLLYPGEDAANPS